MGKVITPTVQFLNCGHIVPPEKFSHFLHAQLGTEVNLTKTKLTCAHLWNNFLVWKVLLHITPTQILHCLSVYNSRLYDFTVGYK